MLRVGVVGCGRWGENHVRALSTLPCVLTGVADPARETQKVTDEYNVKRLIDYRELLQEVDAMVIAVPTTSHFAVTLDCLNARKHILVEKPLTLSAVESEELVSVATEKNVVLSEGYLFRFNPVVEKLSNILPTLGKIHYITSRYIGATKPPRKDSGVVMNIAVHLIDILYLFFGTPVGMTGSVSHVLDTEREDSALITVQYEHFPALVEASCCHPEKMRDMWIIGENAKVYADFLLQKLVIYPFSTHHSTSHQLVIQETVEI